MNGTKRATEAAESKDGRPRAEGGRKHFFFLLPPSVLRPSIGRRASHTRAKGYGQRTLDDVRVIMPERVTLKRVRIPFAESLRFPGEGKSAQG
jgi:hypothetical protein